MAAWHVVTLLGDRSGVPIALGCVVSPMASLVFLYFLFIFDLSIRGSPHHLVSIRSYVALFIKRGESLFREGANAILTESGPIWNGKKQKAGHCCLAELLCFETEELLSFYISVREHIRIQVPFISCSDAKSNKIY
jgi:hypothetical protein